MLDGKDPERFEYVRVAYKEVRSDRPRIEIGVEFVAAPENVEKAVDTLIELMHEVPARARGAGPKPYLGVTEPPEEGEEENAGDGGRRRFPRAGIKPL